MTKVESPHCTFCDSVSDWSAETTESTEIGEEYACSSCGGSIALWEHGEPQRLDKGTLSQFAVPEPLF